MACVSGMTKVWHVLGRGMTGVWCELGMEGVACVSGMTGVRHV